MAPVTGTVVWFRRAGTPTTPRQVKTPPQWVYGRMGEIRNLRERVPAIFIREVLA